MRTISKVENPWQSHDWKVKTLISVTRGGSRLAFTCRSCERTFTHMTGNNQTWRVIMEDAVSSVDQTAPGIYDVRSGSDKKSLDGTMYSEW